MESGERSELTSQLLQRKIEIRRLYLSQKAQTRHVHYQTIFPTAVDHRRPTKRGRPVAKIILKYNYLIHFFSSQIDIVPVFFFCFKLIN